MGHPTCETCGRPIEPGSAVELVGNLEDGRRIFTEDELLFVHATCVGAED